MQKFCAFKIKKCTKVLFNDWQLWYLNCLTFNHNVYNLNLCIYNSNVHHWK